MLSNLEYLIKTIGLPESIVIAVILIIVVTNLIGEILELKGKIVPEFIKMRKYISRKKQERGEVAETLKEVKRLLSDVNSHYSTDNIQKRNGWMKWVNDRAIVYDDSIVEISKKLDDAVSALKDNTKMTEEIFVQSSRDRIVDFATKVGNLDVMVSREEFNRIFKVYNKYEKFLEERGLTNGEVDIAIRIIRESYEQHMKHHTFIEDLRGY